MGLFSPWFLAGLAALALPIWLHLLRQFKRTPQPFSSLMFFERQIQSSSKHRRLRYLALLAMRLLLLAMLALLFANPFVNRASNSAMPRKLVVIAVDRSFSMRFQNHLAVAKIDAIKLVNSLTASQSAQIVALGSRTTTLTQPESDKTALTDAITEISPTDESSSYGELSRALRLLQQTTGLALDVHLFTDAQETSMPASFIDLQLGPHTALSIHEIGTGKSPNWAVESVSAPSRIYDAANVRITTSIAGWETKDATRKVSVVLDGRDVASKNVAVPASGRAELEFTNLAIPYGSHRGQVRISPHDDLPEDDIFPFSIEHADPQKVLFLHAIGRSAEDFFYRLALDASVATGLRLQPEALPETPNLDLSQYALVALNNPGDLDPQTAQHLANYVVKGGSLLIAVGPATTRTGTVPISGEHISESANTQGSGGISSELLGPAAFENVQFFATPRITPKPADRILAHFADASPLLLEQSQGEGRILIFASTLDNSTSDFPIHASFLPFVAATGAYLSGGASSPSNIVVGGAVTLRQSKNQTASTDVIGPAGKHEISLSDATRIVAFNPPSEGFYDVHPASGKRILVAVHADRRESDLTKIPRESLILWRNTSNGGEVAPEAAFATTKSPVSLWRYILALLLIAAIVESIFATRYLSEEEQAK